MHNMTLITNHDDELPIVWRDHGDKTTSEAARTIVFSINLPDRCPTAVVRPRTHKHVVDSIKLAAKLGAWVAICFGAGGGA